MTMMILILQTWREHETLVGLTRAQLMLMLLIPKPPFEKQGFGIHGLLGHNYKGKEHGHCATDPLLLSPENNIHHFNSHFSGQSFSYI